jgi:hypothetical protein
MPTELESQLILLNALDKVLGELRSPKTFPKDKIKSFIDDCLLFVRHYEKYGCTVKTLDKLALNKIHEVLLIIIEQETDSEGQRRA